MDAPPQPRPALAQTFTVRHYETGTGERLSPTSLLDLFQEIAGLDAQQRGFSMDVLLPRGLAWVLNRIFVRFDRMPAIGETLTFTTWPSGADGLYAWRDALAHHSDGTPAARITTRWVLIDVARRRPARLTDEIRHFALQGYPSAVELPAGRLLPPTEPPYVSETRVRYGDLDLNRHTNNVRYAEWLLETLPDLWLDTHRLTSLDLHIKAETVRGDVLRLEAAPEDAHTLRHRISRDGRDVALGRTAWAPIDPAPR